MLRVNNRWLLGLGLWFCIASCSNKSAQVGGTSTVDAGDAGVRIYATYDQRFDQFVRGYRMVSVTFLNQSPQMIEMDPAKDRWTLTLRSGEKVDAVHSLRHSDPGAFKEIPSNGQELIEYPRVILRNTTVTFDLFLPKKKDLREFQQIEFYSAALSRSFSGRSSVEASE